MRDNKSSFNSQSPSQFQNQTHAPIADRRTSGGINKIREVVVKGGGINNANLNLSQDPKLSYAYMNDVLFNFIYKF